MGPWRGNSRNAASACPALTVQDREGSDQSALHSKSSGARICVFVETVSVGSDHGPTLQSGGNYKICHSFVTRISPSPSHLKCIVDSSSMLRCICPSYLKA